MLVEPGERVVARRVEQDAPLLEEDDAVGVAQRDAPGAARR